MPVVQGYAQTSPGTCDFGGQWGILQVGELIRVEAEVRFCVPKSLGELWGQAEFSAKH